MNQIKSSINLSNSILAVPSDRCISKMLPFFNELHGVPSLPNKKGRELQFAIEESYKQIYHLLGSEGKGDFIFTSSGAEAITQVIRSAYQTVLQKTGKNHFLTSTVEEAPVLFSFHHFEKEDCAGKTIPPNVNGQITAEMVANAITPRTALLSLSWVNGLTGVVNPVAEIGDLCRERGILFHLDATHALGKLYFEIEDIGVHFLTFSGEPLHTPIGCGGLWVKPGITCAPLIFGGHDQGGYRAGYLNVPQFIALGFAAYEAAINRDLLGTEISRLRNLLETNLQAHLSDSVVFFQNQERAPHITCIGFPGVHQEALLYDMGQKNIYASIGGGNYQQLSWILQSCGIEPSLSHSGVSFSLSRYTTEAEIEKASEAVIDSVNHLRKFSKHLL